jgi:siroheme synthase
MPGSEYEEVSNGLLDAGLPARTPCAVVSQASRAEQSVLHTSLAGLANHDPLPAPALLIVGECAAPLHLAAEAITRFVGHEVKKREAIA